MRIRTMLFAIAVLLVAMLPRSAAAQTHFSMGVMNLGQMSHEETHYVRAGAFVGDVYFGAGVEGKLFGSTKFALEAKMMPTVLHVEQCATVPCAPVDRFDHRPDNWETLKAEHFTFTTFSAGLRQALPGPVDVAGGVSGNLIHSCSYAFWGACPMLTPGFWGELHAEIPVAAGMAVGLELGTSFIPYVARARYTVISEYSGFKAHGEDFPIGVRPRNITAVYAGVVVSRR